MSKFQYSSEQFQDICTQVLNISSKKSGVSNVCVEISEENALGVGVRQNNIENLEYAQTQGIALTLYKGQQVGHASSADFSVQSLHNIIDAAYHIATYTNADEHAGLPNQEDLATNFIDCDIYHPWDIQTEQAINIAIEMEKTLYETKNITNSEGCGVSSEQGHFMLANSLGFMAGYPYSNHGIWAHAIASDKNGNMQSEIWSSTKRNAESLMNYKQVASIAAKRATEKINPQRISTRNCRVIFEAPIARSLFKGMIGALSGRSQYQKTSFLLNALGTKILPDFLSLYEDPYILQGLASSPFDDDGVKVNARYLIKDGIIETYFLGTYSAKKLNLPNTGHAGGNHNIIVQAKQNNTTANKIYADLPALLQHMGTGLLVTDLMGQGLNITTGDYSKGASGFWVENGIIQYPVEEITIAGNLKQMLQNIVAISLDIHEASLATGSILIDEMTIAGT